MPWYAWAFGVTFWTLWTVRHWRRKNAPDAPDDGRAAFPTVRNRGGF